MDSRDNEGSKLLELSDCVMMTLLSYLDSTSLYNLSKTCKYFQNIIEDLKLWRFMDCRAEPNTSDKVDYCIKKIHNRTSHVLFKARNKNEGVVPYFVFPLLTTFENLKILALEDQYFNVAFVTMNDFPPSLEELSLRGTNVVNGRCFFRFSAHRMKKLRVIILDDCKWIDSSTLVCLGKYKNLEIFSAVGCPKIAESSMPYMSISRNGYKKLQIFDCRFTFLGHNVLSIFYGLPSILAFYFQIPISYYLDYDDENLERISEVLHKMFKEKIRKTTCTVENSIKDLSLIDYCYTKGKGDTCALPKSFLYRDPYGDCECNRDNIECKMLGTTDEHNILSFLEHYGKMNDVYRKKKNLICTDINECNSEEASDDDCDSYGYNTSPKMIVIQVFSHSEDGRNNSNNRSEESNQNQQQNPVPIGSESNNDDDSNEYSPGFGSVRPSKRKSCSPDKSDNKNISDTSNSPNNSILIQSNSNDEPSTSKRNNNEVDDPKPCSSTSSSSNNESSSTRKKSLKRKAPDDSSKDNKDKRMRIKSPDEINSSLEAGPSNNQAPVNHLCVYQQNRNVLRIVRAPQGPEIHIDHPMNESIYRLNVRTHCNHAKLPKKETPLRRLSLRGFHRVTDVGLSYLQDLDLELLDLTYTGVTQAGIEKFLIDNPNCRIIHQKYCVCKPRIQN